MLRYRRHWRKLKKLQLKAFFFFCCFSWNRLLEHPSRKNWALLSPQQSSTGPSQYLSGWNSPRRCLIPSENNSIRPRILLYQLLSQHQSKYHQFNFVKASKSIRRFYAQLAIQVFFTYAPMNQTSKIPLIRWLETKEKYENFSFGKFLNFQAINKSTWNWIQIHN